MVEWPAKVAEMGISQVPILVKEIYKIVQRLEDAFPGRHFTPDGHLVGSIGEVLAAHFYDLKLLPSSSQGHDAEAPDGRKVQVKISQTDRVALRSEPDFLIVLALDKAGETKEIYNGPGGEPWSSAGRMQNNGQRSVSFKKLQTLMKDVPSEEKIPRIQE